MSAKPQNEFAHAKRLVKQTSGVWWQLDCPAYELMIERGRIAQAARSSGFKPRVIRGQRS